MDTLRRLQEYYADQGWTDGLPVVPVTESYLAEFLAQTDRAPEDVVFRMNHLDRSCTVRSAAINAAMAGCRPEYFPVVLAAWDALHEEGYAGKGIWQSTTGTAPMLVVNGPVRERARDQQPRATCSAPGFRANATIGRALRLTAINAFGLRPHQLDQATQGTPAKYTCCIAENEEDSPWAPLLGRPRLRARRTARSPRCSSARSSTSRPGTPRTPSSSAATSPARSPVPAPWCTRRSAAASCSARSTPHLFDRAGWSKADVRQFVYEHAVNSRARLAEVGKDAISSETRWRLPAGHPAAIPDNAAQHGQDLVPVLNSPEALLVDRRRRAQRRGLRRGRDIRPPGWPPGHRPSTPDACRPRGGTP